MALEALAGKFLKPLNQAAPLCVYVCVWMRVPALARARAQDSSDNSCSPGLFCTVEILALNTKR